MGRWANSLGKSSRLPFRLRERAMLRLKQMKTLQKFTSAHGNIHNHFNSERHLDDCQTFKRHCSATWAEWQSPDS